MNNLAGIELNDGSFHIPFISNFGRTPFSPKYGEGGFCWRCECGAKGKKRFNSRILAFNAWNRHIDRHEQISSFT